jgi:hypothetical protein
MSQAWSRVVETRTEYNRPARSSGVDINTATMLSGVVRGRLWRGVCAGVVGDDGQSRSRQVSQAAM